MNYRRRTGLTFRLLLLTLLVAAQSFASAHAIDHFTADGGNICAVCTVGSSLENSTIAAMEAIPPSSAVSIPVTHPRAWLPKQRPVRRPARGPPCSF